MSAQNSYSCFLIGADSLLIECGEILLARGHSILGVISSASRITEWTQSKGIQVLDPQSDYRPALAAQEFDYLFAITHLSIIKDDVLALAKRGAINFHDGPLPHYAGLNTPAWALMNQEPTYGITWHFMTAGIDRGDILKQRLFDVSPGETSLSINTKCFETAMETFTELVDELASGSVAPRAQTTEGRRYFGKHKRPPTLCTLDWNRKASELEALVRALDFGRYPNPLGTAKLLANERALSVTSARAIASEGATEPGTVLAANESEITVATRDGALTCVGFATVEGRPLTARAAVEHTGLHAGDRLTVVASAELDRLTALGTEFAKAEGFWIDRLSTLDPVELPHASAAHTTPRSHGASEPDARMFEMPLPKALVERFATQSKPDAILAAVCAYVARLAHKSTFDLGYTSSFLSNHTRGLEEIVSTRVPLRIAVQPTDTFIDLLSALGRELSTLSERKTWLRDLVARQPHLSASRDLADARLVPITFEGSGAPERTSFTPGETIVFRPTKDGRSLCVRACPRAFSPEAAARVERELATFLASIAKSPESRLAELAVLSRDEEHQVLREWNQTEVELAPERTIPALFLAQVERTPDLTAVVFEDRSLTYRELDERSNRLAHHLVGLGVGRDTLVGIHVERSLDLVVAVLGTLKAGGAYLPLDPAFPSDRLAYMVEDGGAKVIITDAQHDGELAAHAASTPAVVRIDTDWPAIERLPTAKPDVAIEPADLAYVIYTSGSTGKPKGVMVEHRNVANFFAGMDARIDREAESTWLAVTSLSFDISVLELLWTLARGFKVVVYLDRDRAPASVTEHTTTGVSEQATSSTSAQPMDFSLFYFSADAGEDPDHKYRLLLEGARWADEHHFKAVWTPERHFHDFGGLYPHPAITGAALAVITKHVEIRAGSVVVPLHHPVRFAEAWSMVDNLSNGRVAVSIASGWQPDDFILAPHNFKNAKEVMFKDLETIQRLWRGEAVTFTGPTGKEVALRTLPRPIQKELPVWVTTAGNPETYIAAGKIGANVLTHLLGQSVEELAPKIEAYRRARAEHGFDPDAGVVSLMLHTFVSDDEQRIRDTVRGPMRSYLATSLNLLKHYAWAFPAFRGPKDTTAAGDDFASLTAEEHDAMLDHAFERYYEESGLFGTPEQCLSMVDRLKALGVNEIACLVDFGIPTQTVLDNLEHLNTLFVLSNTKPRAEALPSHEHSFAAQVRRHKVTHMQCTPSMAKMLTLHEESRAALASIRHLMIGGEAFPPALAEELGRLTHGTITNMYGPTETTVWSTTHRLALAADAHGTTRAHGAIPIGKPIANTEIYILDPEGRPVPPLIAGELYIGGAGVVRGYHKRPELTSERFVRNPFAAQSDARMYKTGDLARWRENGEVEFLGRNDHQVKIRGYRIELGEIESAIARHPSVREAVVVAREDVPGDVRLVAYGISKVATPDAAAIRDVLRASLPEYMVPAHFVWLERLPLTPNGKIDRKALPAPGGGEAPSETLYVAPSNELETVIAKVWQETLGRDKVGIDDNFFDIGGHSLLVVRMHRRLDKLVEKPVSLTDLYRFTTIRSLSKFLASDGDEPDMKESAARGERRRESLMRRRKNSSTP